MSLYEDRVFPLLCELATRGFEDERRQIIAQATGSILEVGVGTGHNLPYYSQRARAVVGLEISPAMLRRAEARARSVRRRDPAGPAIEIRLGDVEDLEFESESFDTVVSFLVFCSLPDPARATAEIYRVLKPGGRLLVFEHVAANGGSLRWWQDRLNPVWRCFACGCNLNRDTGRILAEGGFDCRSVEALERSFSPLATLPIVHGVAVKTAENPA
jgi:SAM-dependent methyltransferase